MTKYPEDDGAPVDGPDMKDMLDYHDRAAASSSDAASGAAKVAWAWSSTSEVWLISVVWFDLGRAMAPKNPSDASWRVSCKSKRSSATWPWTLRRTTTMIWPRGPSVFNKI